MKMMVKYVTIINISHNTAEEPVLLVVFLLVLVLAHKDFLEDLDLICKVPMLHDSLHCTTSHRQIPFD